MPRSYRLVRSLSLEILYNVSHQQWRTYEFLTSGEEGGRVIAMATPNTNYKIKKKITTTYRTSLYSAQDRILIIFQLKYSFCRRIFCPFDPPALGGGTYPRPPPPKKYMPLLLSIEFASCHDSGTHKLVAPPPALQVC